MSSTELKFLHLKPQHQYYIAAKLEGIDNAQEIADYVSDRMEKTGDGRYSHRTVHDWNCHPKIQAALTQALDLERSLKETGTAPRTTVVGTDPKAIAHTIQESVTMSGAGDPLLLVKLKQAANDGMEGLLESIGILRDIQANDKIFAQHRVAAAKALKEIAEMALKESGTITATMSQSSSTAAADTTFNREHMQAIRDSLLGPKLMPGDQQAFEVTAKGESGAVREMVEREGDNREERAERSPETQSFDGDF